MRFLTLILSFFLLLNSPAFATEKPDENELTTQEVGSGIYMLVGKGGNIVVFAGEDGILMIDDKFAPMTEKIKAAIGKISNKPLRFLVNTHYHFDHTGSNENFGNEGVLIFGHDNIRKRLSAGQFIEFFNKQIPPQPKTALPVVTFAEDITFHLNGDDIHVQHLEHAHTDGDSIIHFKNANTVHMADIYFEGIYPFIDISAGGSVKGTIAAIKEALSLMDDNTKVIPGHGPLSDKKKLQAHLHMLETVSSRIEKYISEGKSLDEIIAAKPTAEFDASRDLSFISPEQFVTLVHESLTK